jgi:hypothetical protein
MRDFYYFWLFLSKNDYEARSQSQAKGEERREFRELLELAIDARRDAVKTLGIIRDQGTQKYSAGWNFREKNFYPCSW